MDLITRGESASSDDQLNPTTPFDLLTLLIIDKVIDWSELQAQTLDRTAVVARRPASRTVADGEPVGGGDLFVRVRGVLCGGQEKRTKSLGSSSRRNSNSCLHPQ